jgi:hypothetical protein
VGIASVAELLRDRACVQSAVALIASNAALWSAIERAITSIRCVPDHLRSRIAATNDLALQSTIEQLIVQTEEAIGFLHDTDRSGYRLFFTQSLVTHWAYFEAFLEDFLGARLETVDGIQERLTTKFGLPKRNRWSASSLKNKCFKKKASFAENLIQILQAIEVEDFPLTDRQTGVLNFSNAMRNCILHNASLWDERGCRSAGIELEFVGRPVEINREQFLECYDVVGYVLTRC